MRLHGWNYASLFSKDADVRERHDHFCFLSEMQRWTDLVWMPSEDLIKTRAIASNHVSEKRSRTPDDQGDTWTVGEGT
jgi:hypothetical protein